MSNEQIQGAATVFCDDPFTKQAVLGWKAHRASFEVLSLLGEKTHLFPFSFLCETELQFPSSAISKDFDLHREIFLPNLGSR